MAESIAEPDAPAMSRRRFGIGDGMILIAACALWIFLCQGTFTSLVRDVTTLTTAAAGPLVVVGSSATPAFYPRWHAWWGLPGNLLGLWISAVGVLMGAVLLLRIRRPHPDFQQILRQPGVLACGLIVLPFLYLAYMQHLGRLFLDDAVSLSYFCGVVPVTWVILWRVKSWPAAVDRVEIHGRSLGWAWIGGTIGLVCLRVIYSQFD